MADIIMDGYWKVWSVPTIANIASPTTTELNAGTQLDGLLTKSGLKGFTPSAGSVDTTPLNGTYQTTKPGMLGLSNGGLEFKAQNQAAETIRNTFVLNYNTNIVIRRNGKTAASAWASTDWVEVWPITCGARQDGDSAVNAVQLFTIEVFFSTQPNQSATIA
jgi:hypothetical protein